MKTVLHTASYKNHLFPTALDDCQFQRFVRDPARGSDQHFGLLTDDGRSQSWYDSSSLPKRRSGFFVQSRYPLNWSLHQVSAWKVD